MQDAISEWPTAARRRFRGGYHGAWLTRSAQRAPSSRCRIGATDRDVGGAYGSAQISWCGVLGEPFRLLTRRGVWLAWHPGTAAAD